MRSILALIGRSLIVLLLCLTWWAPSHPAVHAAAEADALSMRIETPTYDLSTTGVDVPGYAMNILPGEPQLPVRGFTFDLPVNGDWELTFESVGSRVLDERVSIPAVPVPNLNLNGPISLDNLQQLPSSVPVVYRPNPAIYSANALYPASPVLAGTPIQQNDKRILPVRVFPFQYNPVTRELLYHPDLRIAVHLTGAQQAQAPAVAPANAQPKRAVPATDVTHAVRVHTREIGLYRLTYSELAAAGIPVGPSGSDPRKFVLYNDGQPVDIQLVGGADGSFDSGDLVIFYAIPYTGRFQNYNVYSLAVTSQPNAAIMGTRPVTAPGIFPPTSTITQTLHVEVNRDYRTLYERPMNVDHWFDTQLYANVSTPTVTRVYDLNLDDPVTTSGTVQITALIHGGANLTANPDQSVIARLNTTSMGQFTWDGSVDHTITASLPATALDSSPNRLTLEAGLAQLPGVNAYWISPDWIELKYPATAEAEQDRIYVEALKAAASTVVVRGFASPDVKVYDVRQAAHPVQLTGIGAQLTGGAFAVAWNDNAPNRSYYLNTLDGLLAPSAVEEDTLSNWGSPDHQADYIAIIGAQRSYTGTTTLGSELSAALQPLLQHRASPSEGLRVVEVDVLDVYDEFSYGKVDPQAIRDFLTYAYWSWNQGGPKPKYVLLVGDGHYDFTQVSATFVPPLEKPLPNLLPPYLMHVDPFWGEVPTDNRFVSTDGPDDYLPNMSIGRFPVNTPNDVTAMVNKILTYESPALSPPGPWQQRALYVADDCANPAGNFHALSNLGRLQWLPSAYTNRKIYYDSPNVATVCPDGTHSSSAQIRPAVRAAFNQGAFFVQWFGHGSQTRWGSDIVYQTNDVIALSSTNQYPITMANACLTGYFVWQSPYRNYPGSQAMAEVMVITPNKSSVVDFSPSGLHVGEALARLDQGMHLALFRDRMARAGDATDEAKQYYFENATAWHDVIDTMVVFGDPATRLRLPTGDLSASTMQVSETTTTPGASLNYTVTVQNSSIFTTTHPVVSVDYPQDLVTVTQAGGGLNNGDTLTWTLSDHLPGAQQVVNFTLQVNNAMPSTANDVAVPAQISSQMAPSVALQVNTFVPAAPLLTGATLNVNRAWLPPGMPVVSVVDLLNTGTAPTSGTQVTITLPNELGAPTALSATTSTPVYDPLSHRVTWIGNAPAGQTTISVTNLISPTITSCGQFAIHGEVADGVSAATQLSATMNLAVPDVDCTGTVDIGDIQQVAARWSLPASDPSYHPRYDLNADDVIDVFDLVVAANAWQ